MDAKLSDGKLIQFDLKERCKLLKLKQNLWS